MNRGLFITGTDTGVGKTVIAAAITTVLRSRGVKVGAMKPIETGCVAVGKNLHPSDGSLLKSMAQMEESLNLITPYCYESPLAPLVASEIEKRGVEIQRIKNCYRRLSERYEVMIVEGIGGLLVPIRRDYFVSDLIKELGLPILIVAKAGLGTINHTLLTLNYAISKGLDVTGIIINFNIPPEGSLAENTNPQVIQALTGIPLIGVFPYLKNLERESLEKAAVNYIDLDIILRHIHL